MFNLHAPERLMSFSRSDSDGVSIVLHPSGCVIRTPIGASSYIFWYVMFSALEVAPYLHIEIYRIPFVVFEGQHMIFTLLHRINSIAIYRYHNCFDIIPGSIFVGTLQFYVSILYLFRSWLWLTVAPSLWLLSRDSAIFFVVMFSKFLHIRNTTSSSRSSYQKLQVVS